MIVYNFGLAAFYGKSSDSVLVVLELAFGTFPISPNDAYHHFQ